MKTFKNQAAQGDMLITLIKELPKDATPLEAEKGKFILAHSETGHNHVVKQQEEVKFYANKNNPFIAYLMVDNDVSCLVEHERSFDTHETIALKKPTGDDIKGDKRVYEIRRQREYTPEGFRRALD